MGRSPTDRNLQYATDLVHAVCGLAGTATYLRDIQEGLREGGIVQAVRRHDTAKLFEWLVEILSFQGISDAVAAGYLTKYGNATWAEIAEAVGQSPSCPKLAGYWAFSGCGYQKSTLTCADLNHIARCPLPRLPLRNGRINQMAYSLFFFLRDVADSDFVRWVDLQVRGGSSDDDLAVARNRVAEPLRGVYGIADKVAALAMSHLFMGAGRVKPRWLEVGRTFIVVDTLVHNFLHRAGILSRFGTDHPYGPRCYGSGGCEAILRQIASGIDAREFNPDFPAVFPRFIQSAIWHYCADGGLDVCNGNRIVDTGRCGNRHCQLFRSCDRLPLKAAKSRENDVFTAN